MRATAEQVPADTVTMYSPVMLVDSATGVHSKLTLCYPHDTEAAKGFISILSPIGISLIGLRVGALARWHGPDGNAASAQLRASCSNPRSAATT